MEFLISHRPPGINLNLFMYACSLDLTYTGYDIIMINIKMIKKILITESANDVNNKIVASSIINNSDIHIDFINKS